MELPLTKGPGNRTDRDARSSVTSGTGRRNIKDILEETSQVVTSHLSPLIDDRHGYVVLGRSGSAHRKWRRKGLLHIGAVAEHQDRGDDHFGKDVHIDAAFPHIIFICGKRGSGKSYTLGLFAEELIRSAIGVGVILIDPIGIFWSLKKENLSPGERETLEKWGLSPSSFPEVKVLSPGKEGEPLPGSSDGSYTIGVADMSVEDWCQVFDMDRFKTQGLLIGLALDQVKDGYKAEVDEVLVDIPGRGENFSIGDIIQCIERSESLTSRTSGFNGQTRRSVMARFKAASGWGIFSVNGTPLRELTSPNRVTVLDVSDPLLGDSKRSLITGIIARKVLEARIHSSRVEESTGYDDDDPDMIPLTWLLIDEAHVILPHGRQSPATEALIEYAKQGRRPGCALVLATQRPASTSDEILSQVDILIGHNLALEDDMSALRRRVPAKLPPQFANSDFIRAIPVGNAIIADQKTQQRSFLVQLRPRLSHHAGSSAMPKAFQDRKKERIGIPISSTVLRDNEPSVSEPTPAPRTVEAIEDITDILEDEEQIIRGDSPDTGPTYMEKNPTDPFPGMKWGTVLLLIDRPGEELEELLASSVPFNRTLLISREDPDRKIMANIKGETVRFWLSSESSSKSVIDLEDILQEIRSFFEAGDERLLIMDGLDLLCDLNGSMEMERFMDALRDISGKPGRMTILKMDGVKDISMANIVSGLVDRVIGGKERPEKKGRKKEKDGSGTYPSPEKEGALSTEELRWMCNVMGLSSDGPENELLDRLGEFRGELPQAVKGTQQFDIMKRIIAESTRSREENEALRNRIIELEARAGFQGTVKADPKPWKIEDHGADRRKGSIRELDVEEKAGETVTDLIDEVEDLKDEMEVSRFDTKSGAVNDPFLVRILEKMDLERRENLERLNRLEEMLHGELENIKNDLEEQRKELERAGKIEKIRRAPPIPREVEENLVKEERKPPLRKKRVLKKKPERTVILPRIGVSAASETVSRDLKRSILRGPRESVEKIEPLYLPLYRFLISYRGQIIKTMKEGDVYVDGLTGEIAFSSRTGVRRSRGMLLLLKATDLEMEIISVLGRAYKDENWISRSSRLDMTSTRRVLTSLSKKGMVSSVLVPGDVKVYSFSDEMILPKRPWARDPGFEPEYVKGIEEEMLEPSISTADAERMIMKLSSEIDVIDRDIVGYPVYLGTIKGEGRMRYLVVDGITGKVDRIWSNSLTGKIRSRDRKGK